MDGGGGGRAGRGRAAASKLDVGASSMPIDMTSSQISQNFVFTSAKLKDLIDFIQKIKQSIDCIYIIYRNRHLFPIHHSEHITK